MQADEAGQVRAGDEAEVFVARERRDLAEAAAGEKDSGRAQNQVQVLGVGNDGQKDQKGQRVDPPENPRGRVGVGDKERGQVGDHQQEDEEGDEAGLVRELITQPFGADQETADEKPQNSHGAGQGEDGGEDRSRSGRSGLMGDRKPRPSPEAKWLSVTRTKAQKPQKTKA